MPLKILTVYLYVSQLGAVSENWMNHFLILEKLWIIWILEKNCKQCLS